MKKFYKICVYLLIWLLVFLPSFSSARSLSLQNAWVTRPTPEVNDPAIDNWNINGEIIEWNTNQADKLHWILHFKYKQKSEYATNLWYALSLIQITINWILWMLSFVALVYMLYCWFLVFSSWSEDKNAQKGKKGISTAAIALAWIALSWMIVSIMLWFINIFTNQ